MNIELQFFSTFIIIVILSKILGSLCRIIKQPKIVGELISGIILGPTAINLFYLINIENTVEDCIRIFSQIGVVLIIFYAAFEIEFEKMRDIIKLSIITGILGVIFPFCIILGTCIAFKVSLMESIFIALTLSATSVAVSVQTLKELKKTDTKESTALVIVATIDDITIIICLAIFTAITGSESNSSEIGITIGRMIAFFVICGLLVWYLKKYISNLLCWIFRDEEDFRIITLAIIFTYSLVAEIGGKVSMITGAFLIGIIMGREEIFKKLNNYYKELSSGFFVTLFFASIGLFVNLRNLTLQVAIFTPIIFIMAIISKIIGGFIGGVICGMHWKESLKLGIGMVGRGEVGLILATQGLQSNIISEEYYTSIILIVIATTILTPIMLRYSYILLKNKN